MFRLVFFFFFAQVFLFVSVFSVPKRLVCEVVATYPHDAAAWTQGLYYENGILYESAGLYRRSTLRRVELETGKVLQKHDLENYFFAEGMTRFKDKIYQITWQAGVGFVYDPNTFEELRRFNYRGQGWGLTHDDTRLIMSDGSALIRFLDPETFSIVDTIIVKEGEKQINDLNELEYVDGFIYANVWHKDEILKIDPRSGQVTAVLDLSDLHLDRPQADGAVLNGIAYDKSVGLFFVTGKFWNKLYVLKVTQALK